MWSTFFGIFLILHGLVHLLYAGQSWRIFELRPGLTWPDGAWLFSQMLGDEKTRLLASIASVLVALGFFAGGPGMFLRADWWRIVVIASAGISGSLFLVMWDGKLRAFPDQGSVGVLIDCAILVLVMVFKWPA